MVSKKQARGFLSRNLAKVLVLCISGCLETGCSLIRTSTQNNDRLVREWEDTEVGVQSRNSVAVELRGEPEAGQRLEVTVSQGKTCSTFANRLVSRTEVTVRERERFPFFTHIAGALGVAALGGGIAGLATGTPFVAAPSSTGRASAPSWAGFLTLGGALLTPLLGLAIGDDFRALDSRQMEGFRSALSELEGGEDELYRDLKRGVLDDEGYKRQLTRIRSERQRYTTLLEEGQRAVDGAYLEMAQRCLELATRAKSLWNSRSAVERRELLDRLLSNPLLSESTVRFDWRKPYRTIEKMARSANLLPE